MLKEGQAAPDFDINDHTGRAVRLSELRGKKVVLWFYPKADTPGCTAEGCGFRDLKSEFAARNTVVLGVSFDSQEENSAFAKKFAFEFPLLCDTQRQLGMAYGAAQSPNDQSAKRIGVVIDEHGKIAAYYPKVDAKNFPAEVVQSL